MDKLVNVKKNEGVLILEIVPPKVVGEDDIEALYDEIMDEIPAGESPRIVVDFDNVEFISTGFLGQLTSVKNSLAKQDGRLILCSIRPTQREIFRVTHLEHFFELADDIPKALEMLEKPPRL